MRLAVGVKSYKPETIRIPVHLDKLVDVPIEHPLRYHREVPFAHCHAQQRQYVRVAKGIPHHGVLAESLRNNSQLLISAPRKLWVVTHTRNITIATY